MPKIVTARVTNLRLTFSPFSSQQMNDLGEFMIETKLARWNKGLDSNDQPSRALTDRYARRKMRVNRAPVRDWLFRGNLRRAFKVKSANEERVVIGPTTATADMIFTRQRRLCEMLSDSPSDTQALHAYVKQMLQAHRAITVIKVPSKKSA